MKDEWDVSKGQPMGLVITEITFDGPAPSLARIAEKVSELSGLTVNFEDLRRLSDQLHDEYGTLEFACFPKECIEVSAYRANAVKEHLEKIGMNTWPIAKVVQGANEVVGTQTVYVQGYVGQEPTLFMMIVFALEALQGRLREPFSTEVRRAFGGPVTVAELECRRQKFHNRNLGMLLFALIAMPIVLPFHIALFCWQVIKLPWRIRAASRAVRQHAASGEPRG